MATLFSSFANTQILGAKWSDTFDWLSVSGCQFSVNLGECMRLFILNVLMEKAQKL